MLLFGYNVPPIFIYLFILALLLVVYLTSNEENKIKMKGWFLTALPVIIGIGILLYGWNKWGIVAEHTGTANMKWALFLVIQGFMIYLIGKNWLFELKYNTIPFQANGVYGSCSRYYDIGKYTIFYLGTTGKSIYKGFMINWNFADKIVVAPKISWDFNGDGIVCTAQVSKYMLEQVPSEKARRSIESDFLTYFARDEIYYGEFSEKLRTDDPSIDEIESRLTDFALVSTLQKNMIEGKNTILKKHITDTEAMKNKLKGTQSYNKQRSSNPEE